ncbi:MAG TPA: thioredoxin [Longimicrobiales bacterium]|nr:thioredoxin [Longimicrobiales bacterium]
MIRNGSKVAELTDATFASQVQAGAGLTVVDFWAPWCGPCRFVAPVIEELAQEYDGRVTFSKLNVDDAPQTAAEYGIRSIPTIGIFKDGTPIDGVVGAVPKASLAALIEKHL